MDRGMDWAIAIYRFLVFFSPPGEGRFLVLWISAGLQVGNSSVNPLELGRRKQEGVGTHLLPGVKKKTGRRDKSAQVSTDRKFADFSLFSQLRTLIDCY